MKLYRVENEKTGAFDVIAAWSVDEISLMLWTKITFLREL